MKRFAFTAAVLGLVASTSSADARESYGSYEVAPMSHDVSWANTQQNFSSERPSAEEAWYPGCLYSNISTGLSNISGCTDAWYGGCLATSIVGMVNGVTGCFE